MTAPVVSVVIPVYNCGAYLDGAIASIFDQSLGDIEVIAVNDGSTDGSGERLDTIAAGDPRLRVLHVPNGGIVAALNQGLAHASGRYVARMDGDDIARRDRLEKQRAFLDVHGDHVAVGSLCRMIDSAGAVIHVQRPTDQRRQTDLDIFPPFVKTVPHPTLMVRADAIRALGGYRPYFPHAEDHDLFLRLASIGSIAVLGEPLLDYRVHAGAVSGRNRDLQLDSTVRAQMAAVIARRTGADPLRDGDIGAIDQAIARDEGIASAASWAALRALYQFNHDLDRRDPAAARRSLGPVLRRIAADWRSLRRDGALTGIAQRTARAVARLGHITLRS